MSDDDEDPPEGQRKDGRPYSTGNTREDGSYKVGKGRPPDHGQFRKDDGRKRGRRTKGTPNFDTVFEAEALSMVSGLMGGKPYRQTKLRTLVAVAFENATVHKQTSAIALMMEHARRVFDQKAEQAEATSRHSDQKIIELWLAQQQGASASNGAVTDDLDGQSKDEEAGDADQ